VRRWGIASLTGGFKQRGRAFDALMVDVAADPAFVYRRVETP